MEKSGKDSLTNLIKRIEITKENKAQINKIKKLIKQDDYIEAINVLNQLKNEEKIKLKSIDEMDLLDDKDDEIEEDDELFHEDIVPKNIEEEREKKEDNSIYPVELSDEELEERYIGMLLENPKAISMYYILYEDCYFKNNTLLNFYKSVLFTEGQAYAPQIAKNDFNFAKEGPGAYQQKNELREKAKRGKYNFEKTYVDLRKLFEIRKNYLSHPIKETQEQIVGILKYELYDQMTIQEVKDAIGINYFENSKMYCYFHFFCVKYQMMDNQNKGVNNIQNPGFCS